MPYALIPDGYTLKKVTKEQKEAVDELKWTEAIKGFRGSNNSSIFLITALGVVGYFALSQFKFPGFSLKQSFAQAFPQLSAALGIKGELSEKQAETIKRWFSEGAGPGESAWAQYIFPTAEEKARREEEKESDLMRFFPGG